MVRVNIINPKCLADQHLIAEYREILLLFGIYRKRINKLIKKSDNNLMHPIQFYQDKLLYLNNRHKHLIKEMKKRSFKPLKNVNLADYPNNRINDWIPEESHVERVIERIMQRLNEKPTWYRYYGNYKNPKFFEKLMKICFCIEEL